MIKLFICIVLFNVTIIHSAEPTSFQATANTLRNNELPSIKLSDPHNYLTLDTSVDRLGDKLSTLGTILLNRDHKVQTTVVGKYDQPIEILVKQKSYEPIRVEVKHKIDSLFMEPLLFFLFILTTLLILKTMRDISTNPKSEYKREE